MKHLENICALIVMSFVCYGCTSERLVLDPSAGFVSQTYNHFEGGVIFADIEMGLDILWRASLRNNNPFKENVAYFVRDGLLILPNHQNTSRSARLSALSITCRDDKLFVRFMDEWLEVSGIIHTHPDPNASPMPSPGKDYQFCYMGIHNYVMDHLNLYDAYKDSKGNECYKRLGRRADYSRLPFVVHPRNMVHVSTGHTLESQF